MRQSILSILYFLAALGAVSHLFSCEKVAFLFLTRKDLNHPDIWEKLFSEANRPHQIYFHSAQPLSHPYFKGHRIQNIVATSWSIHVRAWQELLREALQDPEVVKFALLSESCIPLRPLDAIIERLLADDATYMYYAKPWWSPLLPREVRELPVEHRWGNYEWIVFNRRDAEIISEDTAVIDIIAKHPHDQESYFSTLLSLHGCLHECQNRSLTFTDWSRAEGGGAHPYCFRYTSAYNCAQLKTARKEGYLFARKFAKEYPKEPLLELIYSKAEAEGEVCTGRNSPSNH